MSGIIAAISTAWGESAIAIVRTSGEGSVALADKFFRNRRGQSLSAVAARRMELGTFADGPRVVDDVLAVRFERGKSYSGEEMVEIHCHGGTAAAQGCLELLLSQGARMAAPGEFTRRAFCNGRLDLLQAEAVASVVKAKSAEALASAERSLQGDLSRRLRQIMDALTMTRAAIEASMDYPEEVESEERQEICREIAATRVRLAELLDRCRSGALLQNGLSVAIVGRPNVGKSSLLNSLCGEERAIVTEIEGTTRDSLDAVTSYRGLLIRFVDTAGIRESCDPIERAGVERSRKILCGADLRLFVLDASMPLTSQDRELSQSLAGREGVIPVLNKADLPNVLRGEQIAGMGFEESIRTSAVSGEGLAELKERIYRSVIDDGVLGESYAATERMVAGVSQALARVRDAERALACEELADASSSMLAEASESLAELLGVSASDELLDVLFANFCVGK